MTVRNVGIVFSPTLNIPAPVFAMFLQNYEAVFGVEPDQYELPSPVTEPEVRERFDHPPRFEVPPRPSTSSGSASPHGQPRLDSVRDYQRSTPTPPLMANPNAARSSPTPPMGTSRQAQESPTSGDSWPTYDTGRGSPAGYDGQGYQPPSRGPQGSHQGLRHQASQEDYSNGPNNYDQFYGSNNRRRESAIFMGGPKGVQPQGSRSRLREETRL
jgi:RalA-binding protein 1